MVLFTGITLILIASGFFPIPPAMGSGPFSAEDQTAVTIHRDESFRETTYRLSSGDCDIEWIARDVEPEVVKYWSSGCSSIESQLPLFKKVLEEYLKRDPNAHAFKTLFWGRIEPETPTGSWEMSMRLALAAHKSTAWDARRGKPENGDINGFVKELANREMIFPEFKSLFSDFNRNIAFSCAEKVLVEKAQKLPFYDELKGHGVGPEDKLPFDCMAWFNIFAK